MRTNRDSINIIISWGMIMLPAILALIILIWGVNSLMAKYNVWEQGKVGQAELSRANWNRQIIIKQAKAKQEAAIFLAQAEVERAKGVAAANKIIGKSLEQNEAYLRYLWIQNLHGQHQVIYVPTEANLPILEANRLKK